MADSRPLTGPFRRTPTASKWVAAMMNGSLKAFVPDRCTLHSFRHSLRDRLRAVECPSDIVDQIGGWQTDGIGQGYGQGYPLAVLTRWMEAIAE